MSVTVKLRFVRHSARKLRPVTALVRGKNLVEALNFTAVMPQDSAHNINKILKMAEAAAKQKEFDANQLIVSQISAIDGPKIKRQRPNARGRANRYIKHLAHLTVTVAEAVPKPVTKERVRTAKKASNKERTTHGSEK